jgi:hypothetical protein
MYLSFFLFRLLFFIFFFLLEQAFPWNLDASIPLTVGIGHFLTLEADRAVMLETMKSVRALPAVG